MTDFEPQPPVRESSGESRLRSWNGRTSPYDLNTTLTPHNIIHGDACFAFFNKVWDIPECILFLICGLAVAANGLLGEGAILAGHSKWARQAESKIPNSRPNKEEVMNKRQLERMETQIKELHTTLKSLADDKVFGELIRIIRRPGFTRPAEAAFLVGLLDSMLGQAKNMSRLKQVVLAGAEKVELNPQPLPP